MSKLIEWVMIDSMLMGSPGAISVAELRQGLRSLPKDDATVIALRDGVPFAAYVKDASEIDPSRLLTTDWIVPGKIPDNLLRK